jgi:hypothetical protein
MNDLLLGHRGFVGGNLALHFPEALGAGRGEIGELHGNTFRHIYCAAPQAKKWWANQNPEQDRHEVAQLIASCRQLKVDGLFYLFGTVDVYDPPQNVDERDRPSLSSHPYGANRAWLENELFDHFGAQLRIIRLPALVGHGLKKNIIFDLLNDNNIDQINPNSYFQWFNLSLLPDVIAFASGLRGSPFLNVVSEPLPTPLILDRWFPESKASVNWQAAPLRYDIRTIHGRDGSVYFYTLEEVIEDHLGPYIDVARQGS